MSIQVYSSGKLTFDSRLPEEKRYSMLSILIRDGLNKGGTATLILPPLHPCIDAFPAYSVPVEIYRNGLLRWRGRPLPSSSDIYGRRTITCEGELCFLHDATHRPYSYKGKPEEIFLQLLAVYNAAVEPWKRFVVGIVSVSATEEVELASKEPEQVFVSVSRLRQMCGGYILFDSAADGVRRINWFADIPYVCKQKIQLGYNLTDYSNQTDTSAFATRIIPYGEYVESGARLTLDLDGKDYVEDTAAIAIYGIVEKPVIYDGVTDASELEKLARADLEKATALPETITLSAVDMSRVDASIDSFAIGQRVEAESKPHNLSGRYDLVDLEEDLLNPTVGSVTVTRDAATYTKGSGTLTGTLYQQNQTIQSKPSQSAMDRAVAEATQWLTNGQGYKVERQDEAGNAIDTLYMDTPDTNTAVNVIRIGQSGIGFSKNGVNGPYIYAWTIDGKFNTDFITALAIISDGLAYLPPTHSDVMEMLWSATFPESWPPKDYYDLNGDGKFDINDVRLAIKVYEGKVDISECAGAIKTAVTVAIESGNSESPIKISGLNMWGSEITISLSANGSRIPMIKGDCTVSGRFTAGKETVVQSLALSTTDTAKKISWRDNGDGTYTLIGTDPTEEGTE